MRYRRFRIPGATYFFTVVTHNRRPLFADPETVSLLETSISAVRQRHPFEIDAQVVLPEHLHTLWTLPEGDDRYATRWRLIKEAFTRVYIKRNAVLPRTALAAFRGEQPVWQRRFWEHTISDDEDYAAHLDYIHINPVHHGLAKAPRDWAHSTFLAWVSKGAYQEWWGSDEMPPLPTWAKKVE